MVTTIFNSDYLDGGAGDDTLVGNGGDDTLEGGRGNDSLEGGDAADVFVWSSGDGNDVITNYKRGDVIQIISSTVSSAGISGNDYVFMVGDGKITVKDGKSKYIYVTDAEGSYWYPEVPTSRLTYSNGKSLSRKNIPEILLTLRNLKTDSRARSIRLTPLRLLTI